MEDFASFAALGEAGDFAGRHIGPAAHDVAAMLRVVGAASLDELAARTVPGAIRLAAAPDLPAPLGEAGLLDEMRDIARRNVVKRSLIGCGYYGTHLPPVI